MPKVKHGSYHKKNTRLAQTTALQVFLGGHNAVCNRLGFLTTFLYPWSVPGTFENKKYEKKTNLRCDRQQRFVFIPRGTLAVLLSLSVPRLTRAHYLQQHQHHERRSSGEMHYFRGTIVNRTKYCFAGGHS